MNLFFPIRHTLYISKADSRTASPKDHIAVIRKPVSVLKSKYVGFLPKPIYILYHTLTIHNCFFATIYPLFATTCTSNNFENMAAG